MIIATACIIGFLLDLALGERLAPICPAVLFGKLISRLEEPLRKRFSKTTGGERAAGALLVLIVCAVALVVPAVLLRLCLLVHPGLYLAVQAFWCYQILATRGLRDAAMKVYGRLREGDLQAARREVGGIVGRDVDKLDEAGVTRAAVETVAENASDGVIAPLLFFCIGGAPLAMLYKAVNTMDSMVGYKNADYRYFGSCAARLDDVLNFVPARITALLMVACSGLCGLDWKRSWRVWRRDHSLSASPNSGHPESAMAGALGVRLLGDVYYFGALVHMPFMGDAVRGIEGNDIARACHLMYAASLAALVLFIAVRVCVCLAVFGPHFVV